MAGKLRTYLGGPKRVEVKADKSESSPLNGLSIRKAADEKSIQKVAVADHCYIDILGASTSGSLSELPFLALN